jgi:hypothetical protein
MPRASEQSLRARRNSHLSWAATPDRTKRTAPGRAAFLDRFTRQVDELYGPLPEPERQLRAESLKKAYFADLALRSAKARQKGGSR